MRRKTSVWFRSCRLEIRSRASVASASNPRQAAALASAAAARGASAAALGAAVRVEWDDHNANSVVLRQADGSLICNIHV